MKEKEEERRTTRSTNIFEKRKRKSNIRKNAIDKKYCRMTFHSIGCLLFLLSLSASFQRWGE